MLHIILLVISVIIVTLSGAYFSINGLMAMFSAAPISVAVMAIGLELSKFVAAAHIHKRWVSLNRLVLAYMFSSVVVLSFVTSIGIYGFLTAAHQKASLEFEKASIELENRESEVKLITDEIDDLKSAQAEIPKSWVSKRIAARRELDAGIGGLRLRQSTLTSQINDIKKLNLVKGYDIGPLMFFAKAMGKPVETIAKWLVLFIVIVFDPLAICLVLALFSEIELKTLEKGASLNVLQPEITGLKEPSGTVSDIPSLQNGVSSRRTYSQQEKDRIIEEYRLAGLSLSRFAADKKISKSMIHSWIAKKAIRE